MRIGIDCDGVLRDFIPALIDGIKETHPEHVDKILTPTSWDWEQWLPFWTEEETEKYVFEDYYLDFFGAECPPIKESVEDWKKLKRWAEDNGHELVLVSAQREHCEEPTDEWLKKYGFDPTMLATYERENPYLFKHLSDPAEKGGSGLRDFAQDLKKARMDGYMRGKLGMVIDSTGSNFGRVKKRKEQL